MTVVASPPLALPVTRAERWALPVVRLLRQPWVARVVGLPAVQDSLSALHPTASLTEVRARVLRVHQETPLARSFELQANALWRGARPGQYLMLRTEIDGRRVQRAYSLTAASATGRLCITVQRQPGGLMSNHLHDRVQPGSVLTLSQALGDFTLPEALPAKMLLLSAGSGITPAISLLRSLRAQGYAGELQFVHSHRGAQNLMFASELLELRDLQAGRIALPGLQLHLHDSTQQGRLDAAALKRLLPDLGQRASWVCGPASWMDELQALWPKEAQAAPLHSERFAASRQAPVQALGSAVQVSALRSQRAFASEGVDNLLQQAERAGLSPKHGCRIGICHSCLCTKRSGTVQNLQTGEVSSAPDEPIRLCISAARSDLQLDL